MADVPLPKPAARPAGLAADRHDLGALYETSRLLSGSLDVRFILGNLLLTAMSRALTTRGVVLLWDEAAEAYRVGAQRGVGGLAEGAALDLPALDVGTGLVGDAVPEALRAHRIALVLPIRFGSRDVGAVGLGGRLTGVPYSDDELSFLRSLVSMTAPALENARTVEQLEAANRSLDAKIQQLETLFELSQAFAGARDRTAQARLLALTLMGQTTALQHAFLTQRPGGAFEVLGARGFARALFDDGLVDRLCALDGAFHPDDETDALVAAGAKLVVPLKQGGATCGVLVLGAKASGATYDEADAELIEAIGSIALTAVRNAYLLDEQLEKRRMEEEMRLARSIQERLLPQKLPAVAGVDLAAVAIPSRAIGGDLYDAVVLKDGRLLVAVADVTGKGVPAALLMANIQACLHVLLPDPGPLDEAVARINRVICENTNADKFITAFFAAYDPAMGALEYVNAGHNPPYVVRAGGEVEELREGGLLLGVMAGLPYSLGQTTLRPGDVLALFTDGVTEAMGAAQEEFGEDRVIEVLLAHRTAPAAVQIEAMKTAVEAFTGPVAERYDDFTLIILRASERI